MRYRKKPVEVEALQYDERDFTKIIDFVGEGNIHFIENPECTNFIPYINTPEGRLRVSNGDYVIKGIKGEFYLCKPDIFEQTYEKI